MRTPRLVAAGAACGALAACVMFGIPATADAQSGNCNSETSGQQGYTCPKVGSNLLRLNSLPLGANLSGNCNGLLNLLVQARNNENTYRSGTLAADENAAAVARDHLASAKQTDTTNDAVKADSLETGGTDQDDAAVTTAQAAVTAADAKVRQDKAEENRLLQLTVQLGNDYRNCNTPTPAPPTTTTEAPPPVIGSPAPTTNPSCGCTTPPAPPAPSTVIEQPPPVILAPAPQAPIYVAPAPAPSDNSQVGTVPSGPVNTGATTEADRYLG